MLQGALSQLLQIRTSYLPPSQTASKKCWHLPLVSRLFWLPPPLGDVCGHARGRMAAAEVTPVP